MNKLLARDCTKYTSDNISFFKVYVQDVGVLRGTEGWVTVSSAELCLIQKTIIFIITALISSVDSNCGLKHKDTQPCTFKLSKFNYLPWNISNQNCPTSCTTSAQTDRRTVWFLYNSKNNNFRFTESVTYFCWHSGLTCPMG